MEKLYIIIPAYNEQDTIESVVREWHPIVESHGEGSKLVILNDGSKDNTYGILKKLKDQFQLLTVIDKPNSGHGATLLYGYKYALREGADYVFQTDSDGQTLPCEFEDFWKKREHLDAVIGYRKNRKDGFSRIMVTKTLKLVLRIIFGVKVTDANTPYRIMKKDVLAKYIDDIPKDFNLTNVLLTVFFIKGREKVEFMPITFRKRQGGVNSINIPKITKIGIQALKDFREINKIWKQKHK